MQTVRSKQDEATRFEEVDENNYLTETEFEMLYKKASRIIYVQCDGGVRNFGKVFNRI